MHTRHAKFALFAEMAHVLGWALARREAEQGGGRQQPLLGTLSGDAEQRTVRGGQSKGKERREGASRSGGWCLGSGDQVAWYKGFRSQPVHGEPCAYGLQRRAGGTRMDAGRSGKRRNDVRRQEKLRVFHPGAFPISTAEGVLRSATQQGILGHGRQPFFCRASGRPSRCDVMHSARRGGPPRPPVRSPSARGRGRSAVPDIRGRLQLVASTCSAESLGQWVCVDRNPIYPNLLQWLVAGPCSAETRVSAPGRGAAPGVMEGTLRLPFPHASPVGTFSILSSVPCPSITCPKIVYLPAKGIRGVGRPRGAPVMMQPGKGTSQGLRGLRQGLTIQVLLFAVCDKKLAAVRVWPTVGH